MNYSQKINHALLILWIACTIAVCPTFTFSQDKPIASFTAENGDFISSIAVSPDENYLFVGTRNGVIWDLREEKIMATLPLYSSPPIFAAAFSPDSKKLLVGTNNVDVTLWDLEKQEKIYSIRVAEENEYLDPDWRPELGPTQYMIFSKDGNIFYTASFSGVLQRWDTATGKEIDHFVFDNSYLRELNLTSDPNELLIEYGNGFFIYNFLTGKKRMTKEFGQCSLNLKKNILLQRRSVDNTLTLRLFDITTERLIAEKSYTMVAPAEWVEFFPAGNIIILSSAYLEYLSSISYSPRMILDANTFDAMKTYPLDETSDKNSPENVDAKVLIFPSGGKFATVNGMNVHLWDVSNLTSAVEGFSTTSQ